MSIMNLKLYQYDEALNYAIKYNNDDDIKKTQLLADIYFKMGAWDNALFYYYRSILADKENLNFRFKLAKCLIELGSYEKAINALNIIIQSDIYYEDAYYELGKTYLLIDEYKKWRKSHAPILIHNADELQ